MGCPVAPDARSVRTWLHSYHVRIGRPSEKELAVKKDLKSDALEHIRLAKQHHDSEAELKNAIEDAKRKEWQFRVAIGNVFGTRWGNAEYSRIHVELHEHVRLFESGWADSAITSLKYLPRRFISTRLGDQGFTSLFRRHFGG